jgi:hypothetical protein
MKHEYIHQPRANRGFILNNEQANFMFHDG